ncbi:MAG: phosphatidate cytidylyltransferase [Alphaproteobacteria bacterium]|nr:phosphatidate cytidylyltransferase [Alphaproteobacteria bacterium]
MTRLRTLSALVLAPVTLAAVYAGSPVFDLLVITAGVIMAWEWTRLTGNGRFGFAGATLIAVIFVDILIVAVGWPIAVIPIAIGGAVITAGVANWEGSERPIWMGAGALYVGLPSAALLWLRDYSGDGLVIVIWLLVVVWATDIGAYFAGRTIGGPKLAPAISPNKTWAGLAGGVLLAGATGAVIAGLVDVTNATIPAVVGGLMAIVAQAGDLVESKIKRIFGVKDTSNLIPGHGGLLDRLDGVVAVAPTLVFINWIWGGEILTW